MQEKERDGREVGYLRAAEVRTWHFCCLLVLIQVDEKVILVRTDGIQATGRG